MYNVGPFHQTFIIGEFLTGGSDPESEGYTSQNGWLSLGSSDGRFGPLETSPTLGAALGGGLLTSVPPPEFTVVDADAGYVVHVLALTERAGTNPPTPNPPGPGQLQTAAAQYKQPSTPAFATIDISQYPSHSQWISCEERYDDDPDSPTYGAVIGFFEETGQLPGYGSYTVGAAFGGPAYSVLGPDTIFFAGREHRIRGGAGLDQGGVRFLNYRADCGGQLGLEPALYYRFNGQVQGAYANEIDLCGHNPTRCDYDSPCGCPTCVQQGPPCWPEPGMGAPLQDCKYEIPRGGNLGFGGMVSAGLDICTVYKDQLPSGSPTDVPFLGTDIGIVSPNISYADTGLCPRSISLQGLSGEIDFATMGISF